VDVLVQQSQLHAARTDHLASISRFFTSDESEDRSLAGAVSPDEPHMFAGIDLQRGTAQDVLRPIRLMNF
jgi:hypothetical protein